MIFVTICASRSALALADHLFGEEANTLKGQVAPLGSVDSERPASPSTKYPSPTEMTFRLGASIAWTGSRRQEGFRDSCQQTQGSSQATNVNQSQLDQDARWCCQRRCLALGRSPIPTGRHLRKGRYAGRSSRGREVAEKAPPKNQRITPRPRLIL